VGNVGLDPDAIAANIDAARARKAKALVDYEAASAELAWWLKGAELVGLTATPVSNEPSAADVEELFPPAEFFERTRTVPTLRQAIMSFFREHPAANVRISNIAEVLLARGWLSPLSANKRITDLTSVMCSDEQLVRVSRGVYHLHPKYALSFEQNPPTDYRRAAEMGMPVPLNPPEAEQ
jgi:hypothetical protein